MKQFILADNTVTEIGYPVNKYPSKIKIFKTRKESNNKGELLGIKGQYLILDNDRVFNVRSHEGFIADFFYSDIPKQSLLF